MEESVISSQIQTPKILSYLFIATGGRLSDIYKMNFETLEKILKEVSKKPPIKDLALKILRVPMGFSLIGNFHETEEFKDYVKIKNEIEKNLQLPSFTRKDGNSITLKGDQTVSDHFIGIYEISQSLLFHAALFGFSIKSLDTLEKTLNGGLVEVFFKRFFSGLIFEKTVYLGDDLEIIPYKEMNILDQEFAKALYGEANHQYFNLADLSDLGFFVIQTKLKKQKVIRKKDEDLQFKPLKKIPHSLFINLFSVFFKAPIIERGNSLNVGISNPLSMACKNFNIWQTEGIHPASYEIISKTSIEEIFFQSQSLSNDEKRAMEIAARRYNFALQRKNYEDRFLDLAIALEAIILNDMNEELTNRLCNRAAWYLGKNITDREKIYSTVLAFYKFRSKIIHGGEIKHNNEMIKVYTLTSQFFAEIVKKILKNGKFPDWERITLGGKK